MINLKGKRFGKWVVLYRKKEDIGSKSPKWTCLCDCGTIRDINGGALKRGDTKSCGCLKNKELVGNKFGRLLVVRKSENKNKGYTHWTCLCECGVIKDIRQDTLLGGCQSCGCLRKENSYKSMKKYNKYDLSGEYGVGWTTNTNKEFYFDLEDYEKIKDYCWAENRTTNYITTGKCDSLHCIVMEEKFIDHIGGNRSKNDNRKINLRKCTNQQNQRNRFEPSNNTSGHKGVVVYKNGNNTYWRGQLYISGKQYTKSYSIKTYGNEIAYRMACEWVEEKNIEMFEEFSPYKKL